MQHFQQRRDLYCLAMALILLLIALVFDPVIPLKQERRSHFLLVDISQSMNVQDMSLAGKTVSRLQYTRAMLHGLVGRMACGSHVSIGLFAGSSVAALYAPMEVCRHYHVIQDTIAHLDWKNAWSANSRIRESLASISTVLRSLPLATQPVLFTDGEEAPKLHAFNRKDLTHFQAGADWLFVGIGSQTGTPIPKYIENDQLIGYWSNESFAVQPGISQISEGNLGARDESVALSPQDRYLSRLDARYLQSLAKEIGAQYVSGQHLLDVVAAMQRQKPAQLAAAPFKCQRLLAGLAGLFVILAYLPAHPLRAFKRAQPRKRLPLHAREIDAEMMNEAPR